MTEDQGIVDVWFFDKAGRDVDGWPRAWVEIMADERTARAVCNTMMAGGISFPNVNDHDSAERAHRLGGGVFVTILGTFSDGADQSANALAALKAVGDYLGFDGTGCPDGYDCEGVCDLDIYGICPYATTAKKEEV